MKHFYKITDGVTSTYSGFTNSFMDFTEYDPATPPQELIELQEDVLEGGVTELSIPSELLIPPAIGGQGDGGLIELAKVASSMGADIRTHIKNGKGLTCIRIFDTFIANLPAETRASLEKFITK